MILIISQTEEYTTDRVIDWVDYLNVKFKRINGVDFYRNLRIEIKNSGFKFYLKDIDWDEVTTVWFRRWVGFEDRDELRLKQPEGSIDKFKAQFNISLNDEYKALSTFFLQSVINEKLYEPRNISDFNKLIVLKKARELDIKIPDSYVLTSRNSFELLADTEELITKAISEAPIISFNNDTYLGFTSVVKQLPDVVQNKFGASLFQNHLKKKYEVRSFLMKNKIYSMAIFSQSDPQTATDFRVYNHHKPNRTVPYCLPDVLEKKLLELARFFSFKTCSFDIVKTVDNEYVFLEINPDGQFGMVSYPCNYYLEKKLAYELAHSTN